MSQLVNFMLDVASRAGIAVPHESEVTDPDEEGFDRDKYPHLKVFWNAQIGKSIQCFEAREANARIVASIPESEIRKITFAELRNLGFKWY